MVLTGASRAALWYRLLGPAAQCLGPLPPPLMHRSTLVLLLLAFGFAGCADLCGRACGNGAYNRTLAQEAEGWRYDGEVEALQRAAIDGLVTSRGHAAPEDCFDDDNICRFDILNNVWEFRIEETRSGLRLTATEKVGETEAIGDPHVVVAAIALLDPLEAERIRTLATANGERARQNTTAKCDRFWDPVLEGP